MAKFQAGQSGNPGGRPKTAGEIREIARRHTGTAIETLVTIMSTTDASPSARVAAASALLDRGWGRPEQSLKASIQDETSFSELLQQISEYRRAALGMQPKLVASEQA